MFPYNLNKIHLFIARKVIWTAKVIYFGLCTDEGLRTYILALAM